MEEILSQPTRQRIYAVVQSHPGASARDVQRLAGLAWGETAYHLDQMIRVGALRRERGGRRDYYFTPEMTWADRRLFSTLRSPAERTILLVLLETPRLSLAEVQQRSGTSLSTASFHLRQLLSMGVIEGAREGNVRRYRLVDPARVRLFLTQFRTSFEDRLLDRFVEVWSSML